MQKSFVNRLHLVLHAYVETFDVTVFFVFTRFMEWELPKPSNVERGVSAGPPELKPLPTTPALLDERAASPLQIK